MLLYVFVFLRQVEGIDGYTSYKISFICRVGISSWFCWQEKLYEGFTLDVKGYTWGGNMRARLCQFQFSVPIFPLLPTEWKKSRIVNLSFENTRQFRTLILLVLNVNRMIHIFDCSSYVSVKFSLPTPFHRVILFEGCHTNVSPLFLAEHDKPIFINSTITSAKSF